MKRTLLIMLFAFLTANFVFAQNENIRSNPYVQANNPYTQPVFNYDGGLVASATISVLVLSPDSLPANNVVKTQLSTFADLAVQYINNSVMATIALSDLSSYQVVFAFNDKTWETSGTTRTVIGNLLKDYIDGGGKVVEGMYLKSFDDWGLAGGYITGNYSAFGTTSADNWDTTALGTIVVPTHPIMTGVTTLQQNWGIQNPTLAASATRIADWDEGSILVAAKPNVVSINMLPVEPDGTILFDGDGWILYHNAIVWLIANASVNEANASQFSIYPNPASDILNVNMQNNSKYSIIITDYTGRTVGNEKINGNHASLNIAHLSNGVYLAQLLNEKGETAGTHRFVKK